MAEHGPIGAGFAAGAAKFMAGDTPGLAAVFAPDAEWILGGQKIKGREAMMQHVSGLRDSMGWRSWELLSSAEGGSVLTLLDRTTLKDGTVFLTGSTASVDREGRIRRLITIPGTPM